MAFTPVGPNQIQGFPRGAYEPGSYLIDGEMVSWPELLQWIIQQLPVQLELPDIPAGAWAGVASETVSGGPLPTALPKASLVVLEVNNLNSDLNLSGWVPTGIEAGTMIRVRKTDNSIGRIVWNDGPIPYRYVSKPGEFMTFIYDSGSLFII